MLTTLIFKHLLFFSIGIFQDILITYYYQMIAKENAARAGIFSTIVTLVNLLVLYEILAGIENQILSVVFAYALGNGVGTMLVVKKHQIKKIFGRKKI